MLMCFHHQKGHIIALHTHVDVMYIVYTQTKYTLVLGMCDITIMYCCQKYCGAIQYHDI